MDNVIVTPHSLCWTDECFHNMASIGLTSIVDALAGRRPEYIVNREVLSHPRVQRVDVPHERSQLHRKAIATDSHRTAVGPLPTQLRRRADGHRNARRGCNAVSLFESKGENR